MTCRSNVRCKLRGPMTQIVAKALRPVLLLAAISVAACSEKPAQAPAAAAPSVTVATPVKRTVTDWDEFTGRFEAVEQVDVRARVGGFVNMIAFSDGQIVHKDDLLYLIDSRPYDAAAAQVDGQLADARARVELGKRELDRTLELQ